MMRAATSKVSGSPTRPTAPLVVPTLSHDPHVLVAACDAGVREARERQLTASGLRVRLARTGFEAIVKASYLPAQPDPARCVARFGRGGRDEPSARDVPVDRAHSDRPADASPPRPAPHDRTSHRRLLGSLISSRSPFGAHLMDAARACYHRTIGSSFQSPSSRGLGRGPFKAKTRVRIPLGTPRQECRQRNYTGTADRSPLAPSNAIAATPRSIRREFSRPDQQRAE